MGNHFSEIVVCIIQTILNYLAFTSHIMLKMDLYHCKVYHKCTNVVPIGNDINPRDPNSAISVHAVFPQSGYIR